MVIVQKKEGPQEIVDNNKRQNADSTNSAKKRKFGSRISFNYLSSLLLLILSHNIISYLINIREINFSSSIFPTIIFLYLSIKTN